MAFLRVKIRRFITDKPTEIHHGISVVHPMPSGTIAWVGSPESSDHDVLITIEEHDTVTRRGNDLLVTGGKAP